MQFFVRIRVNVIFVRIREDAIFCQKSENTGKNKNKKATKIKIIKIFFDCKYGLNKGD
jgi:hypothetical protein